MTKEQALLIANQLGAEWSVELPYPTWQNVTDRWTFRHESGIMFMGKTERRKYRFFFFYRLPNGTGYPHINEEAPAINCSADKAVDKIAADLRKRLLPHLARYAQLYQEAIDRMLKYEQGEQWAESMVKKYWYNLRRKETAPYYRIEKNGCGIRLIVDLSTEAEIENALKALGVV